MMADFIPTPTMSEILREEFMEPMNLSAYKLAQEIHVPVSRIQAILNSGRRITADTSLRLAKFFGVSDRYFLDMQNDIDIRNLKMSMEKEIADILQKAEIIRNSPSNLWRINTIDYILKNERYIGDALFQKFYTTETLDNTNWVPMDIVVYEIVTVL